MLMMFWQEKQLFENQGTQKKYLKPYIHNSAVNLGSVQQKCTPLCKNSKKGW